MNKVIHLSLARKSVPVYFDVVQATTAPAIDFIIDDWTPPASARARIYIKKDGGEIYNNCTLSGNVVTYTPTAGSFDVVGECYAQLELLQSTTVAVSWPMVVTVAPNYITGSAAPASTEFGALTALIQSAQQYDTIINANNLVGANARQGWIALTSGTDLDDIKNVGYYYAVSSIVSSLLNCPATSYFKMRVEGSAINNAYVKQVITYGANVSVAGTSGQEIEYTRVFNGVSWAEWFTRPLRSEVNAIANQGAKNLLIQGLQRVETNGITFTKNADGSVTATGTATATANYNIAERVTRPVYLSRGTYILTGCPQGGSPSTYYLAYSRGAASTTIAREYGNGVIISEADADKNYGVWIAVAQGQTVDNLTFFPMIRDAAINDSTYVPYGMSNDELTTLNTYRRLAAGDDLNDLKQRGVYTAATSAITNAIIHRPTGCAAAGFVMYVDTLPGNETLGVIQLMLFAGIGEIYQRGYSSSGWSMWNKATTTLVDPVEP